MPVGGWRVPGGRQARRERAGSGAGRRGGSVRSVGLQACGSLRGKRVPVRVTVAERRTGRRANRRAGG